MWRITLPVHLMWDRERERERDSTRIVTRPTRRNLCVERRVRQELRSAHLQKPGPLLCRRRCGEWRCGTTLAGSACLRKAGPRRLRRQVHQQHKFPRRWSLSSGVFVRLISAHVDVVSVFLALSVPQLPVVDVLVPEEVVRFSSTKATGCMLMLCPSPPCPPPLFPHSLPLLRPSVAPARGAPPSPRFWTSLPLPPPNT